MVVVMFIGVFVVFYYVFFCFDDGVMLFDLFDLFIDCMLIGIVGCNGIGKSLFV